MRRGNPSRRRREWRERPQRRRDGAQRSEEEEEALISLQDFDELADGLNHPEGVAWNPFNGVVYAGGEEGELYRITLDGEFERVGSTGGGLLGLALDADGRVYACDMGLGCVSRYDPATGAFDVYGKRDDPLDTPNVAVFDEEGNLFVTCSGDGGRPEIVRIDPDGEISTWSTAVPGYPNGAVVTPDGSSLLVVEAHADRVARVPIDDDGSAGEPETFVELPDTDADGLALDAEGYLWITLYRPDGIVRADPSAKVVQHLDDHLASTFDAPTNIAFSGKDLSVAVVANVGGRSVLKADFGVAGQPLFYPKVRG
ncbi:MAG: SMP-30/gluconolactonase/LRE family protein [Actinomycetota bacterium]